MFGYRHMIDDHVISRLMESEYEEIPVIITANDCQCDDLEKCIAQMGGKIKYKFPLINAVAAYMPSIGIRSVVRERAISKVHYDHEVYKLMDMASVTVGSDYAHESGLTGKNIGVAIVDTGVHPHSDLITPTNRIVGFKDFIGNKARPYDDDGHGTHVAGIVAGNGFSSKGKYMGIAPDANIIGVKVLNENGGGSISDVIAGVHWVVENKNNYNIKVMTLSLGTKAKTSYDQDPLCKAVEAAVNAGVTVICAAGNSGPEAETINSPGISPSVITVGACDDRNTPDPKDDRIAHFSSRGPTIDGLKKPDLLAPGVNITSLSHKGNEYASLSGTSMAAPVVAGCVALLYEHNPRFSPREIKSLITSNALSLNLTPEEQGAGVLDIRKILKVIQPTPKPQPPKSAPGSSSPKQQGPFSFFHNEWFLVILLVVLLLII